MIGDSGPARSKRAAPEMTSIGEESSRTFFIPFISYPHISFSLTRREVLEQIPCGLQYAMAN